MKEGKKNQVTLSRLEKDWGLKNTMEDS